MIVLELALMLALAVVLSMLGPFGTYLLGPWPHRLVYWIRSVLVGYLIYRPLILLGARQAIQLALPEWAGWAAGVLAGAAPMSLWLWWLGPDVDLARPWPSGAEFVATYAQTALIAALGLGALWHIAGQAWPPAPERTAAPVAPLSAHEGAAPLPAGEPAAGQRLLERLPPRLGREIIALGMEDHYVRVFTRRGDTLILMRMADAIHELGALEGAQVHRSWWVCKAAVAGVERRGRGGWIRLDTGLEVPVARRRLAELARRGWPIGGAR
ncbi:LytTR family transcriptional regulator [Brevundimonas naejangsanensis]|uniref:LytTR family transcriptional regulator n=2 Tax=Brevundimonas naejangsanensis TaxID=588932 RepID=A0A494RKQ9_9CAUL|nr:LytTR family transcriptional regulator [Brevundimonas naejangsanensis]